MKHLHMLMAALTIALFLYQSYLVLSANDRAPRTIKIASHIIYALLIVSGGIMLMQLMSVNAPVQWAFAKIILLVAAVSSSMKAFNYHATVAQKKAGVLIATIAYVGIVILAFAKPGNLF
ncbi:SirB2 family protein [Psychrobacter sp.]|uniref:SirB2 family protein n=1 Tax=Psychrobacter sp. TaxID=56811 RepID=UPI002649FDB2|nr:SirB2 family protein [Psychrobacter sp.]MDN6276566.1 SirB2 family protein [Psychrobacter sp.]MDN6308848.1 SirB2 family protein [Psychrobacter sp.]